MPAKNNNSKAHSTTKTIALWISVVLNVMLIIFITIVWTAFSRGMFDYSFLNKAISELTDSDGCFMAQDASVKQDAQGRVLTDEDKLVCIKLEQK